MHGGHVTAGTDLAEGYDSWRKAVERVERPLPMLIENTAGGDGAMARSLDNLARLWDAVGGAEGGRSASAWTPVMPSRPGRISPPWWTGSRRSPAGSTWCT